MVGVVATVVVLIGNGVLAGVLVAVAIGLVPVFTALPAPDYIRVHTLAGRYFDRIMPPLVLCSIGADVVLVVDTDSAATRPLFALAALAQLGVSLVSQFGNVPLNQQTRATDPADIPPRWDDPRTRWRALHTLRTVFALVGLFANAIAVAV
ncbi:anthrone oxygenase family protein [Nocardia brasiliensis]|uniref:anthrone oxygenase family protein n=1 Tax=Nocardia brasiliensis TaxID=37326 RepID=UPI0036704979